MMHYGYSYGFSLFPFFPLVEVVLWIAVIGLVVHFLRGGKHHHWHGHDQESAEDVLRERFARGDIAEKEYRERLKVLQEHEK